MAPIWVADPCGSVKPKNALPAVAVAAAAVETGVAAVETDVAAVETDAAVGEEIAGVAASRTALETDFRPVLLTLKSSGTLTNAI